MWIKIVVILSSYYHAINKLRSGNFCLQILYWVNWCHGKNFVREISACADSSVIVPGFS